MVSLAPVGSTVETVRGPVELAELGPTLMHEHVFVLDPEALINFGHVWGAALLGRGGAGRRRDREAAAAARQRHPDARRPHGARARPEHPAHPADQRRGRPQHRRRDRRLRLPRAAELPGLPVGRCDRRALRAGASRRDRRHGRQGRLPEMRGGAARPRRRRAADPGRGRRGERRDRRAGDGPHERGGEDGPAGARGAHERRGRPDQDRDRPRRRQQRPRLPARDRRHGRGARLRPLQHRALQPR